MKEIQVSEKMRTHFGELGEVLYILENVVLQFKLGHRPDEGERQQFFEAIIDFRNALEGWNDVFLHAFAQPDDQRGSTNIVPHYLALIQEGFTMADHILNKLKEKNDE